MTKYYELRTQTYTQQQDDDTSHTTTKYADVTEARIAFREAIASPHNYLVEVLEVKRVAHMCWDNLP